MRGGFGDVPSILSQRVPNFQPSFMHHASQASLLVFMFTFVHPVDRVFLSIVKDNNSDNEKQ